MLFVTLESPKWVWFYGTDFIIFRPKIEENVEFWIIFTIKNLIKLQNFSKNWISNKEVAPVFFFLFLFQFFNVTPKVGIKTIRGFS
jgi:hypothetical protein